MRNYNLVWYVIYLLITYFKVFEKEYKKVRKKEKRYYFLGDESYMSVINAIVKKKPKTY